MKKKQKLTLIIGPRRSGKTTRAVEMALKTGGLVGAICPTKEEVAEFQVMYGIMAIAATTEQPACRLWRTLIVVNAHHMTNERFLRATGDVMPHGADIIVTACPPHTKRGEWVMKLKDAGFTVETAS